VRLEFSEGDAGYSWNKQTLFFLQFFNSQQEQNFTGKAWRGTKKFPFKDIFQFILFTKGPQTIPPIIKPFISLKNYLKGPNKATALNPKDLPICPDFYGET